MLKNELKQIVYLTYLAKGYPKKVQENHSEEAYQAKLEKTIDQGLEFAATGFSDGDDLSSLFPGLSPEDVSLNDQFLDTALEYAFICSAYAWRREYTTPEYRRMIYDSKKRLIAAVVRDGKRLFGATMLIRHFPDEKFEKLIRYELEMSDKSIRMTCLPWYDMKPFYTSAHAYKLMKKKQDYVSLPSEYDFEGTDEEHQKMMQMGGAMCLMSFIVDAIIPTPEPKKKGPKPQPKKKKVPGQQPVSGYQKKPYNPDFKKRPYDPNFKPRSKFNSGDSSVNGFDKPRRPRFTPNENGGYSNHRFERVERRPQNQELGPNGQVMRHRRPRIQKSPEDSGPMPTIDNGTTKL